MADSSPSQNGFSSLSGRSWWMSWFSIVCNFFNTFRVYLSKKAWESTYRIALLDNRESLANNEQNSMNENRRLSSALIVVLIILSSQAVSSEHLSHKVEILSPQPSEQYFENVDIQFKLKAKDSRDNDIHKKILWRITNRFTRKTITLSGLAILSPRKSFTAGFFVINLYFTTCSLPNQVGFIAWDEP